MSDGADKQLQRIAKALGWDRCWPTPQDDATYIVERSVGDGQFQAQTMDSAIARRSASSLTEEAECRI